MALVRRNRAAQRRWLACASRVTKNTETKGKGAKLTLDRNKNRQCSSKEKIHKWDAIEVINYVQRHQKGQQARWEQHHYTS